MSYKEVAIFTGGDSKYFAIMVVFLNEIYK